MKVTKERTTRQKARIHLEQFTFACELVRVIRHFFPGLLPALKKITDPRNTSYITYSTKRLLMTRILSSIFYISSMRKTSEEFNSEQVISNIGFLCEESNVTELPYWETIQDFLKNFDPEELQTIIVELVCHLIRSRAFEQARIHKKYWQIIMDGTQLTSSKRPLDEKSLYRVHNRGKENESIEYYYYVLEAKLVLHPKIQVSIMTVFVENDGREMQKQDCERKACYRLMES